MLHLHKHAIWFWFCSFSSRWRIGDIITPIRFLHGCTSVWFIYSCSLMKYLSLSSNKHVTLHQMSVHFHMHWIHIIIISTLQAHNHIIIKVICTSHNHIIISTYHVHQSKENIDNDMYTRILSSKSHIYIYIKRMGQYKNGHYSSAIDHNDTKWCWHTNRYIARDQQWSQGQSI